jgi:hypothetical protein
MNRSLGRMVSKAVYGEQIWKEMGQDLSHWNTEAVDVLQEAGYALFLVDVFHFCEYPNCLITRPEA